MISHLIQTMLMCMLTQQMKKKLLLLIISKHLLEDFLQSVKLKKSY